MPVLKKSCCNAATPRGYGNVYGTSSRKGKCMPVAADVYIALDPEVKECRLLDRD